MPNTQAKPDLRAVTIAIVRKGAEAQRNEEPRRKQRGIRKARTACPHGVADKHRLAP